MDAPRLRTVLLLLATLSGNVTCLAAEPPTVSRAFQRDLSLPAPEQVSFRRHIQPLLTKAGCNSGACHGSFQGRGGLTLSLLGYDSAADHEVLFTSGRGRRHLAGAPSAGLLVRKAFGITPHGGGTRITPGSTAALWLTRYLKQGSNLPVANEPEVSTLSVEPQRVILELPAESDTASTTDTGSATESATATGTDGKRVRLRATAGWSDQSQADVTPWALFDVQDKSIARISADGELEPLRAGLTSASVRYAGRVASVAIVVPERSGPKMDVPHTAQPVEPGSSDPIDTLIARSFRELNVQPAGRCSDTEFLRRVTLDLIGRLPLPEEIRAFVAQTTADKRRQIVDELMQRPEFVDHWSIRWGDLLRVHRRYLGDKGLRSFHGWLQQAIRENTPLDQMTRALLTAQGNLFESGAVGFYFVDQRPEDLSETVAQVFLGVRLQCARCHHHPQEIWSQQDYQGLAAFFTRLEIKDTGDEGRFGGFRAVRPVRQEVASRKLTVPAVPQMLGTALPEGEWNDIREPLAGWITSPQNPFFARSLANRYWGWLIGRGLVHPVDDLRATNPPSHPEVLDELTRFLVESKFDARKLMTRIIATEAYQRASELTPNRDEEGILLTHRVPRRLSAEALLDSINQACETRESFAGVPTGTRAAQLADPAVTSHFLTTFGRPLRNSPCECARGGQPDLAQALLLANGQWMQAKVTAADGRVARLLKQNLPAAAMLDELYLATLSRWPTPEEQETALELLQEAKSAELFWQDLLWALLNTAEFSFQH